MNLNYSMEKRKVISIESLPEEVFEFIALYLNNKDIDACFNVCTKWRNIFNSNKTWKRFCYYPEKCFKNNFHLTLYTSIDQKELCTWRKYYKSQEMLMHNWTKGQFLIEKTGILKSEVACLQDVIDEQGNHWLFGIGDCGITVWNLTDTPLLHCKINQADHIGFFHRRDKVILYRSNYIKVFHFKYPEYEMKLNYRFKFNMDEILPVDQIVPNDEYMSGVRFISVDNFFIGYSENVSDIHLPLLHFWNLDTGKKVATKSAYQDSFASFILHTKGVSIKDHFNGGLLLFEGNLRYFLVNLINDTYGLCQITLYSLDEMRFVSVIAQLESRTAWCFLQGSVVAICHTHNDCNFQISIFTVTYSNYQTQLLTKLEFPYRHNPALSNEFWFSDSKIVLKVKNEIKVVTIIDAEKAQEHKFKIKDSQYILAHFNPRFLFLFGKSSGDSQLSSSGNITVFDSSSGLQLWSLENVTSVNSYSYYLMSIEYPGKIIVNLEGDKELSILNFENTLN